MVEPNSKRKFGDYTYTIQTGHKDKAEIEKVAKKIRSKGYLARIVPVTINGNKVHGLYAKYGPNKRSK